MDTVFQTGERVSSHTRRSRGVAAHKRIDSNLSLWYHCYHFGRTQVMASITIRNIPDEVHRALRVRAAMHGRSAEAEIRDILEQAAKPEGRVKLGSLLSAIGREAGIRDEDVEAIQGVRDKTPAEPMKLP
jgi:antitoxin FitA